MTKEIKLEMMLDTMPCLHLSSFGGLPFAEKLLQIYSKAIPPEVLLTFPCSTLYCLHRAGVDASTHAGVLNSGILR